jgi:uncharacterized protein YndB with AHSA1/START domain
MFASADDTCLGSPPQGWVPRGEVEIDTRQPREVGAMEELGASSSITIAAPIDQVWQAVTTPELIKQWFFGVDTESDWKPGSPLIHRGEWQGKPYVDKGEILRYQEVTWALSERDGSTELTITERNLPSEETKAVSEDSWKTVLTSLKDVLER